MILKIEGYGNGIKTNIVNLKDVSKALRVPTECKDYYWLRWCIIIIFIILIWFDWIINYYFLILVDPLEFMKFEYGSLIIFKEKGNSKTTIINGEFSYEQLSKALDKFINKYVLCPRCKYPEFVLRVRKGIVCGKCDSCGERAKCDNLHKFASYIIKNPPKIRGIKDEKEVEDIYELNDTQPLKTTKK